MLTGTKSDLFLRVKIQAMSQMTHTCSRRETLISDLPSSVHRESRCYSNHITNSERWGLLHTASGSKPLSGQGPGRHPALSSWHPQLPFILKQRPAPGVMVYAYNPGTMEAESQEDSEFKTRLDYIAKPQVKRGRGDTLHHSLSFYEPRSPFLSLASLLGL